MSINSHLTNLASELIITSEEKLKIAGNLNALSEKLSSYFAAGAIKERFAFGSYTRDTLMPRRADPESDVDYMIVFNDTTKKPGTYIEWLKNFAEAKYSRSEIYRAHPTVVLELSNIKIELVPALNLGWMDSYEIPAPAKDYQEWLTTHPNEFNNKVSEKNTSEKSLIRPLIRLMKYWNAQNGFVFSSYDLENRIVSHYYWPKENLWVYLYGFVNGISSYGMPQSKIDKIDRLKKICSDAKSFENVLQFTRAEEEIKKAFPSY